MYKIFPKIVEVEYLIEFLQMEQDNVSQNKGVTVSNESAKDEEYIKIENAESKNGDCTEVKFFKKIFLIK